MSGPCLYFTHQKKHIQMVHFTAKRFCLFFCNINTIHSSFTISRKPTLSLEIQLFIANLSYILSCASHYTRKKKLCFMNSDYLQLTHYANEMKNIMPFPTNICTQFQPTMLWHGFSSPDILLADLENVSLDYLYFSHIAL